MECVYECTSKIGKVYFVGVGEKIMQDLTLVTW